MSGATATITLMALLTCGLLIVATRRTVQVWRRYRGTRLVTCPETGHTAAVDIDAKHAALTALFGEEPVPRLAACCRWATRGRCDEDCLPQITADGQDRAVRTIVERWSTRLVCHLCGKPIGEVSFLGHHAALGDKDGTTIAWTEIPPERLPDAFRTHVPICWNCHLAETFRRLYPELVEGRR